MGRPADLPGSANLELVANVVHLDPAPAVLDAMMQGWTRQGGCPEVRGI
jgi:integrase/recombinase XerC